MAFETDVFVNCPFDEAYLPLLRPILFAIVDLGFGRELLSNLSIRDVLGSSGSSG